MNRKQKKIVGAGGDSRKSQKEFKELEKRVNELEKNFKNLPFLIGYMVLMAKDLNKEEELNIFLKKDEFQPTVSSVFEKRRVLN
jgi:hypothetical protein